jgi:hypothetical protein
METQKHSAKRQWSLEHRMPHQSDNNTGTVGVEGGLPHRRHQLPFEPQDRVEDLVTGNMEYDRHHKPERLHKKIMPISMDDEIRRAEINSDLPGNRPDNHMISHAEDYSGADF